MTGTLDTQDSLLLGPTLDITLLTRILQFEALINRYKKIKCMESAGVVCVIDFSLLFVFLKLQFCSMSQVAGPGKGAVSIFRAH